ncbi:MAG: FAD-binding oxidoreductase [Chloroflexi bacterium]|nr:FAD-binding oxidoreductase [Chloroflexota bacterium]
MRKELGEHARHDAATRALYSSDASNYRIVPGIVVAPGSADELASVVGLAVEAGVPVTMRGAGTSIAGNAIGRGVVIETRRLSRIIDIDPEARTATVEPGVVLGALNTAAAAHRLRVGPDPSTHSRCTLGGMIGNDACGSRSVRWGSTARNVLGLHVITAAGERLDLRSPAPGELALPPNGMLAEPLRRFAAAHEGLVRAELPEWDRRVSGYLLDWLLPERGFDVARALVGTEGTCGVASQATIRLWRPPTVRCLLVLGFADDIAAADAVPALLTEEPYTVESLTDELLALVGGRPSTELLPDAGAWLLVEAGGEDPAEARAHAERLARTLSRTVADANVRLLDSAAAQATLWRIREDGAGYAARLPDGSPAWPGFEDAAVPPERLGPYLRELHTLLRDHEMGGITYGHFGEGCIHLRVGFGLDRPGGRERFRGFMEAAADLVARHGGSLSGEHGDGRARGALLDRIYSPAMLDAFRRFKAVWDPDGLLNPGIIVEPVPVDADLRWSAPTRIEVHPAFAYHADHGDARAAVSRCIGVGRCVSRQGHSLMCPSYRASGREQDSTRGRARMLQEMMAGSLSGDGWRSTEVRDALDLCLSCKGCLSECPTGVDMASYKSEFLHHHYRGRIRPRSHYLLGQLPRWLRLGWRMAPLGNRLLRNPVTGPLLAWLGGISGERRIPPLARTPFTVAHAAVERDAVRQPVSASGSGTTATRPETGRTDGAVTLWPDSFTNYLAPEVGHAAVRVLRDAGHTVSVPTETVCCALTWITTGQLDGARKVLRSTLDAASLAGDAPVVVLEPSCAASLRVDLPELLPDDPRARALADRVVTLAEQLDRDGYMAPPADTPAAPALSQPHCHQQAVLGTAADGRVLARNEIAVGTTLAGCCGLAGNFGAERGHETMSRQVAELALAPALRATDETTPILADGFSCRTQIAALSGRQARHLAEVLAERLDAAGSRPKA